MALDFAPMLADRGLPKGSLDYWAVEPKLDGWRATVLVDEGGVVVRTRRGRAINDRRSPGTGDQWPPITPRRRASCLSQRRGLSRQMGDGQETGRGGLQRREMDG